MKKIFILISVCVLVITLGTIWLWPASPESSVSSSSPPPSAPDTRSSPATLPPLPPQATETTEVPDDALAQLDAYQNFFETQDEFRTLMEEADELDEATREERFNDMVVRIKELEEANKVSATESLLMQLALLKFSPYPEQAKARGQALIERYREISEARRQAHENNPDPRFVEYKAREAEIVQEVMAMSHYPDGLSREAYLARRLQALRSELYAVSDAEQP